MLFASHLVPWRRKCRALPPVQDNACSLKLIYEVRYHRDGCCCNLTIIVLYDRSLTQASPRDSDETFSAATVLTGRLEKNRGTPHRPAALAKRGHDFYSTYASCANISETRRPPRQRREGSYLLRPACQPHQHLDSSSRLNSSKLEVKRVAAKRFFPRHVLLLINWHTEKKLKQLLCIRGPVSCWLSRRLAA